MTHSQQDTLDKTIKLLIIILISSLVITTALYKIKFPGNLSSSSGAWSDFGSFFGGIFSPLISFASLVAILKTISLQKIILNEQRSEFEQLISAQQDTNEIQRNHLLAAEAQAKNEKIATFITTNIQMLEQQINLHQSIIKRCNESLSQIKELLFKGADISLVEEKSKELTEKIKESEKTINILSKISIQISLGTFNSIADVKLKIMETMPQPV